MPTATKSSLTEEAVGGLSAGVIGTVIGFPLDTVKARQQVLGGSTIFSTASRIVKGEGFLGLCRGLVPPLVSLSILNTVNFTSYSYFQSLYGAHRGWDVNNALAGATCGPIASTVSTVETLIKTQLQLDNVAAKRYKGSFDCVRQLVRREDGSGLRILYTGHTVNTARETAFLTTYFSMYEGLREALYHYHGMDHPLAIPAAGGTAGAIAWAASFPLDCVRAGVQGQDLGQPADARKSAWHVFSVLIETRGIGGLYSGVAPSIVRAFLVSGSRFTAYEAALWLLRGGRDAVAAEN